MMTDDSLDCLQRLLQGQLALVRQGRLDAAAVLFKESDRYVCQIAEAGRAERPMPDAQWQRVERLYGELRSVLTAQQAQVADALEALRRTKKVLHAYGQRSFRR
jgi:hypothetical protein